MVEKIYRYLTVNNMLAGCSQIVVGISGGADSVCLLRVLDAVIKRYDLSIELQGVHINHGIRGKEAKRDEDFAAELCRKLGVAFTVRNYDIPAMAERESLSEEEAGRIARYEAFRQVAAEIVAASRNTAERAKDGADSAENKEDCADTEWRSTEWRSVESGNTEWRSTAQGHVRIAVAHHRNDQAETVLMNMLRGSSIKGLCGMQPVRDDVIRPLLCVTRKEIESYLVKIGQPFMNDSTNMDVEYTRNKLRNVVIPYLEEHVNAHAVEHISDLALAVSEAEEYIAGKADKLYKECVEIKGGHYCIRIEDFGHDEVLQKYVIRRMIGELSGRLKDVYRTHIDSVLALKDMQVGRMSNIAYSITAVRTYNAIELYQVCDQSKAEAEGRLNESEAFCVDVDRNKIEMLEIGEKYSIDLIKEVYTESENLFKMRKIVFERVKSIEKTERNDYTIYFDYDKIKKRMSFRNRCEGDKIVVNSEGGLKKLKKEMVDRKVPREYRPKVLLLALENEILWLAGIRRGESAKVDKDSQRVIKVTIDN